MRAWSQVPNTQCHLGFMDDDLCTLLGMKTYCGDHNYPKYKTYDKVPERQAQMVALHCRKPAGQTYYKGQQSQPNDWDDLPIKAYVRSLLLLLLMSNLLLCKHVASQPFCPNGASCRVSLRELFDRAIIVSHYIHSLSSEMFQEFDAQYSQGPGFFTQAISMCHTASISTPAGKEQAQQIHQKDFVILVIHLLRSWTEPLNHLITETSRLPKDPHALRAKAVEIQQQNQRLLEGLDKIGKLVDPEITDNGDYAVWLGLPALQSNDVESLLFAFHNMFRCLRRDTHKVDNYLKFLKCQIAYDGSC
ncbi:prolactin [Octodon degus]|uniref:Prolactin n=1 Tax=Octodon degus TaxID=10160 RepID=A0A6P3FLR5_OCTDE|nr:prolactin [Octodon degus]